MAGKKKAVGDKVVGRSMPNAAERARNRASPKPVVKLYDHLTDDQKEAIASMDLGTMLDIKCKVLHNPVINWLAPLYDRNTREFVIPGRGRIPLNPDTVHHTLGLPQGELPVPYGADPDIRATLHNIVARSIRDITEAEMASIIFSIMKEVYAAPAQELAREDFYVSSSEMQFILEKYTTENVDDEALYFPATAVCGLRMPGFGPARMYHKNIHPFMDCDYNINGDDETGVVILQDGWEGFAEDLNIVEGSLLLARLEVRSTARIFLDFVEVINPPLED